MIRRSMFFLLQEAIGSHPASAYREFLSLEKGSRACLDVLSQQRMAAVLRHAADQVPFYREKSPRPESLTSFPIVSKDDLRERFEDFMDNALRNQWRKGKKPAGYGWIKVLTGGSTGCPTATIHDADFRDRGRASRLYSQRLCGFPFGTPYARLWGSMKEINQMRDSITSRVMRFLAGETVLNAFRMTPGNMDGYLNLIRKRKLQHLMAYVDAAEELARYAISCGAPPQLESVMACAGTVTDDARHILHQAFGARVHNKYGSRDCADMACECREGGLHVYSHQVHIEVVDDDDRPLPAGETGHLLVTLLANRSFPLIRYRIGDMGAWSDASCSCGSPFPLLGALEGRSLEFLQSQDGAFVSPVYIRHMIGVVHNPGFIRRFQLVQEERLVFRLNLEIAENAMALEVAAAESAIKRDLLAVLGRDVTIEIVRTDRIAESDSGKFLYTINRAGKQRSRV